MRLRGLVDTGALFALVNSRDPWHDRCAEVFASISLPLATSAAVLAELFYSIMDNAPAKAEAWAILRSGAVTVLPITDDDLADIRDLMDDYADRPMDFADATLVRLARRESLTTIFTIDHDDFETYRIKGRSRFHIVPAR